ncbi:MAG: response regulator transcription factor [Xenophilus sp.]
MRVLVVEDDGKVSYWLGRKLQASGHSHRLVDNGEDALEALGEEAFDVMILDRMLPGMDGIEVLRRLRGRRHPPVLILSTVDQPSDRVDGLRAGAEDYVGKPFDMDELLVRMEILVRRHRQASPAQPQWLVHDLRIDPARREVTRAGRRIGLTDKEFQLLCALAEHVGQTVPRSMLLARVWGLQFDPQTNLIDVHVSKLRAKIDKGFDLPLLKTVRSLGYALG